MSDVAILRSVFELSIYIPSEMEELREKYMAAIKKHNNSVVSSIVGSVGENGNRTIANEYFDAGFDLFCPDDINIDNKKVAKINHQIVCAMRKFVYNNNNGQGSISLNFVDGFEDKMYIKDNVGSSNSHPVSYYMYPRSSTGTKTPLRLANSVGIIDSGYRGNIIAAFNNITQNSDSVYEVEKHQRLVQICPPDISHPMYVRMVDNVEQLGSTVRGAGGFGSTGR